MASRTAIVAGDRVAPFRRCPQMGATPFAVDASLLNSAMLGHFSGGPPFLGHLTQIENRPTDRYTQIDTRRLKISLDCKYLLLKLNHFWTVSEPFLNHFAVRREAEPRNWIIRLIFRNPNKSTEFNKFNKFQSWPDSLSLLSAEFPFSGFCSLFLR